MVLKKINGRHKAFFITLFICVLFSCSGKNNDEKDVKFLDGYNDGNNSSITFNVDSAFSYIKTQVDFGPRVPGTNEHQLCAQWLFERLSQFTDTVVVQSTKSKTFKGTYIPVTNIVGRLNPEVSDRIILLAHYDSRPWADAENDVSLYDKPIDGANDGASGVGVILELARILHASDCNLGIDFLFVDAEDYGVPQYSDSEMEDSWCLGTQEWIKDIKSMNYTGSLYAVLLDMVGGKDARFHREYFSDRYAKPIVDRIWATAASKGYSYYFVNEQGNPITDDHIYFLQAGIPAVDIIENKNPLTGSFNPTWHTHADNISNIDKNTLQSVGETILEFLLNNN